MGLSSFHKLALLPLLALLAGLSGCAQKPVVQDSISVVSPAPSPPMPNWDTNAVGRTKLDERFRQLLRLANLSPFDVRLEGSRSHPVLVGQVPTAEAKAALGEVLLALKQVQGISNKLEVVPAEAPAPVSVPRSTPWGYFAAVFFAILWLITLISLRRAKARLARISDQAPQPSHVDTPARIPKAS